MGLHSHWKFACITVQIMANITPGESEIAPKRLVMAYAPHRIQDLSHDVSTMPDSDIKRLLEDREKVMEEIRLSNFEAQEAATEKMMERQAGMFRDLPTGWGKPRGTGAQTAATSHAACGAASVNGGDNGSRW